MKKLNLLFVLMMISVLSFGQVLIGPPWMVSGDVDYSVTPYEQPTYNALKAPDGWEPIASVSDFDATWDLLGDPNFINNKTGHGNYTGTDYFDLDGAATFGASWKAVHKDNKLYLLIKQIDVNDRIGADGNFVIEVMSQPLNSLRRDSDDDPIRWEPTFEAGTDITTKNYAYLRFYELGGYKLEGTYLQGKVSPNGVYGLYGETGTPEWSGVIEVIEMFADLEEYSYWNKADDGTHRIVVAMDFEKALSYPEDPENIGSTNPKVAFEADDVVILDIKTNAWLGGAGNENRLEHFWAADTDNGYSHIRYNGLVTVSSESISVNISEIAQNNQPRVYFYNSMLYVRGSEPVNLEVYNVIGAKVKSAQNVHQLSLNELNNGLYLIRVNGEGEAIKIVK